MDKTSGFSSWQDLDDSYHQGKVFAPLWAQGDSDSQDHWDHTIRSHWFINVEVTLGRRCKASLDPHGSDVLGHQAQKVPLGAPRGVLSPSLLLLSQIKEIPRGPHEYYNL